MDQNQLTTVVIDFNQSIDHHTEYSRRDENDGSRSDSTSISESKMNAGMATF